MIWVLSLLSHPPTIRVMAQKVPHHAPYYIFNARLLHSKPPCKEAFEVSQRLARLHLKTVTPSKKRRARPLTFNPLTPIYLHCDSAQGCLEFISIYPSLKITSIGNAEQAGLYADGIPGNASVTRGDSLGVDEQATGRALQSRGKRCSIVGCNYKAGNDQYFKEHLRKKHRGPLHGKCPVIGCLHFTSSGYTRKIHWSEKHSNQRVWLVNHTK